MEDITESEDEDSNQENSEVELIEDIFEEVTDEERIYGHPYDGLLVSYEYDSNDLKSDTYKDSVTSTQHTYESIDANDAAEVIHYDNKSVISINEEN